MAEAGPSTRKTPPRTSHTPETQQPIASSSALRLDSEPPKPRPKKKKKKKLARRSKADANGGETAIASLESFLDRRESRIEHLKSESNRLSSEAARLDKQRLQIEREAARLEQAGAKMCQDALAKIVAVGGDPANLDPNAVPEGLLGLQRDTQRIEVSLRTWEAAYKRLEKDAHEIELELKQLDEERRAVMYAVEEG
ncbi:hypothetical protein PENSPDRAFT_751355 [Peniophora sp. CONT]|nr:hypothetical protein PENSPDRAFT_751355 [Peniophora sp. CONT]